jgi:hypothetical protein
VLRLWVAPPAGLIALQHGLKTGEKHYLFVLLDIFGGGAVGQMELLASRIAHIYL